MNYKIAFIGNSSLTMHNFRINLLRSMVKQGYDVVVIAPKDSDTTGYKSNKIRYIPIDIDCKGLNPVRDLFLVSQLRALYKKEKFDFIFHYTIKPVIYGSIAARMAGIKHISVITGLGYTFLKTGYLNKLVISLYRNSLKKAEEVWFLNEDDREVFLTNGIVEKNRTKVINGEGVNARIFRPVKNDTSKFKFLFVGRMLWDKGIGEFVGASKILKKKYPSVEFEVLGSLSSANPSAISREIMDEWETEGSITYLGETQRVIPYFSNASCIVLPSYREGISRVLLEASAMEKPIVATNVTGCKDIVEDGVSGFLCKVHNIESLADAMEKMILLPKEKLEEMGKEGRRIVLEKFDEKIIMQEYHNKLLEIFPQ